MLQKFQFVGIIVKINYYKIFILPKLLIYTISFDYIINCLELGIIVDLLNYVFDEYQIVDPTKIMFNEWYSTPDFILSKYPKSVLETDYMIPFLE